MKRFVIAGILTLFLLFLRILIRELRLHNNVATLPDLFRFVKYQIGDDRLVAKMIRERPHDISTDLPGITLRYIESHSLKRSSQAIRETLVIERHAFSKWQIAFRNGAVIYAMVGSFPFRKLYWPRQLRDTDLSAAVEILLLLRKATVAPSPPPTS